MVLLRTVTIDASKDGVKFACQGDIGAGAVTLRSHANVEKPELGIDIELTEPVSLTFSLKYLVNFCKASALSSRVKICLSNEVPLLVEYEIQGTSWLRFYLAPKVRSSQKYCHWLTLGYIADYVLRRLATRSNCFDASHTTVNYESPRGADEKRQRSTVRSGRVSSGKANGFAACVGSWSHSFGHRAGRCCGCSFEGCRIRSVPLDLDHCGRRFVYWLTTRDLHNALVMKTRRFPKPSPV